MATNPKIIVAASFAVMQTSLAMAGENITGEATEFTSWMGVKSAFWSLPPLYPPPETPESATRWASTSSSTST